ncbi:MAG: hypothetical protein K2N78_06110 [Oscillospiraceae bacterium]|nr:hypothetical protein [Oscillospiraceae bacterium]
MAGTLEVLAVKLGPRLPGLLARAAAGDPIAIAILGVSGAAAVAALVKGDKKE